MILTILVCIRIKRSQTNDVNTKGGPMKNICKFCFLPFPPNAPNQKYCDRLKCRKERRRIWQKNKRATDKDYRENQAYAFKAWAEVHPDYWSNYRDDHPEYTKKNRENQKRRNEKRKILKKLPDFVKAEIAKMEKSNKKNTLISGYYVLIPLSDKKIAKIEKMIIKIDIFSKG